jgi:arylsulfatase A-like enzyme
MRNQLMHNSDLFPTLLKFAGVKLDQKLKLDGVDQWNVINFGGYSARSEIVNIDDVLGFGSYIYNTYKLVNGTILNGIYDGWAKVGNDTFMIPMIPKIPGIDTRYRYLV